MQPADISSVYLKGIQVNVTTYVWPAHPGGKPAINIVIIMHFSINLFAIRCYHFNLYIKIFFNYNKLY